MSVSPKQTQAEEWKAMRLLRLLYVRLAREFALNPPPCDELDSGIDVPSKEDVEAGRIWFRHMDDLIQVHQLRQFLQTTTGVNEETLIAMAQHHIHKPEHNEADRDKVDFLLVQFLTQTSPARVEESAVDMAFVANGLEPALGRVDITVPEWLGSLEDLMTSARSCHTLNNLFSSGVLEKGRNIKVDAGENYFVPGALVAFARFNFLLRRVFFRLMQGDINAILDGLHELEARGVQTLDCTAAQFSDQEPTAQLRMVCQSWKIMFQAEYSSGQPMRILADLRAIVETAVGPAKPAAASAKLVPAQARAAAASASSPVVSDAPEFEVSGGSHPAPSES
jgi:hypothetical protein